MCFRDAMFPLLARMRRGLFYNTYLVPGCHGSGLMQAFSKHLISRLGTKQLTSDPSRVRVTLLFRSTKHRRIVNQDEVVIAVRSRRMERLALPYWQERLNRLVLLCNCFLTAGDSTEDCSLLWCTGGGLQGKVSLLVLYCSECTDDLWLSSAQGVSILEADRGEWNH